MGKFNQVTDLVTIGKLARDAGLLPSTVRYYVKEVLLQVVDHTPGGFFCLIANLLSSALNASRPSRHNA